MIEIIATAKKMGIFVIVVDRDPCSPAKKFADLAVDISTDNIDGLEELCKKENVDGIFTGFEDFNIHIACTLCERLKLPFYATSAQLEIITNKINFKKACKKFGVPIVEQYTLNDALENSQYPYIVKPADSYGSRGITVCKNAKELTDGDEKAKYSSFSNTAIIERFIDADYGVELFYTVVNGNIHLTVTADRYTVRNGDSTVPLPVAEIFPSRHSEQIIQKLDQPIRKMLCELDIKNGLVLIQALRDFDGEFFVYEMAYRFTGEQHYRLVQKQRGVNLSEMMIKLALGEDITEYDTELLDEVNFDKPSANLVILLKQGKIKNISGLDKIYRLNEVISYNLTHSAGDVIDKDGGYSRMLIRINMVADNYPKLCRAIDLVDEHISVISENEEDMLSTHFHLSGAT